MKNGITKRQKDLLHILYRYIKDTGFPPNFEEIKQYLGVASNQSVLDLLHRLKEKGFIKRNEGEARSIAILPLGYEALGQPPLVPFMGVSAAGAPLETVAIQGEWQTISSEVARLKDMVFILKISGDSMINAGINDGDMVLVQDAKEFSSGEIVLAQVGDSSTVKRFISEDKPPYMYLKPENPNYKIILFSDDIELKGKVISVLKNGYWQPIK